jgi:hypothetical protein
MERKRDCKGRFMKGEFKFKGKSRNKICKYCKNEFTDNSKLNNNHYCNKECRKKARELYHKEFYKKNKDKYLENSRKLENKIKREKYREKNRENAKLRTKIWRENNHEYMIKRNNKYKRIKRKIDKKFNLKERLRCRLNYIFREYTKTGKIMTSKQYGIDYKAIIEHLKPFPEDLSKYHIDHNIPLCSFNFVNPDGSTNLEEVKKAFAPENHQWLTIEENLKKGGKLNCN